MLVAAAVCPHPPLLVPGLATGPVAAAGAVRRAAAAAVAALLAAEPDLVVVVGGAPSVRAYPAEATGSLAPYGVDVRLGAARGVPSLPLSLTIGRWLLDRADGTVARLHFGVAADADAARCADLGAALAGRARRVGLLAMGDASARRSRKGPGYLDPRAAGFDAAIERALAGADAGALLTLDAGLADELMVAGRAGWQVLAGAALASTAAAGTAPASPATPASPASTASTASAAWTASTPSTAWTGDVRYAGAPYGVTYLVATWLPRRT